MLSPSLSPSPGLDLQSSQPVGSGNKAVEGRASANESTGIKLLFFFGEVSLASQNEEGAGEGGTEFGL